MSKPEWLYGIHTIAAVLGKHPDRVLEIKLQDSRDDKRLADIARLAQQAGIPLALVPLVMVAMNAVYAVSAYPFGALSDRMSHPTLLALGLVVLIAADLVLATGTQWGVLLAGVVLWGVHMGMTQGLLASMIAHAAPADLRGTAYGFFNLVSGLAMLAASLIAGLLWDSFGATATFHAGAIFCGLALAGLIAQARTIGGNP